MMQNIPPDEMFDINTELYTWVRYRHPNCSEGKDKALSVIRVPNGWYWECHRCGESGFRSRKDLSPDQIIQWAKRSKEINQKDQLIIESLLELPPDCIPELPSKALAWLYKFGITDQEIQRYQMMYSPVYDRLIVPLYEEGKLIYWQGRNLGEVTYQNPKYINVASKRSGIYFKVYPRTIEPQTEAVYVVEDIVSAIKMGRTWPAWALLNASINDALIFKLIKQFNQIRLWLDPDKWSRVMNYIDRYRSFGINVVPIYTSKDPKYFELNKWGEIQA